MNRKGDIYGYENHHDPYRPASDKDEALLDRTFDKVEALDDAVLVAEYEALPTSSANLDVTIPDDRQFMVEEVVEQRCLEVYLAKRAKKNNP